MLGFILNRLTIGLIGDNIFLVGFTIGLVGDSNYLIGDNIDLMGDTVELKLLVF